MFEARAKPIVSALAGLALVPLAACGETDPPAPERQVDPAVLAAINDPILVDPDLSRQNEANAALTGGIDGALPLENRTPRAVAAARDEAMALVGGREAMMELPPVEETGEAAPLAARLSLTQRAVLAGAGEQCAKQAERGFIWAARMPEAFPLYPRAAAQDAAGNDSPACALRAAAFRTPVPLAEVLAFYHTRARAAGYTSRRSERGEEQVLQGTRGGAAFAVYAHADGEGATAVDLVAWRSPRAAARPVRRP